jgi:general secretion pathway protein B
MSYILDALKKSDQKRQEGKVPDLQTISEETKIARPKRLLWPLLLTGVLLANAAVISLWFFTRDSKEPEQVAAQQPSSAKEAAPTPAVQVAPPVTAKPPAPQPAVPVVPALPGIPAFQPGRTVDPVVVGQPQSPMIQPDTKAAKISTSKQTSASRPTAGETPQTGQPPMPLLRPTPAITPGEVVVAAAPPGQPALETALDQPPAVEADVLEEPIEEEESPPEDLMPEESLDSHAQPEKSSKAGQQDPSKKNVLDIMQLPGPVQSKLPNFHISAHFYSANPPSRLASVNGRIMREGQNLSPGLTLQEITQDGLIFSYEGHFFQVGVY